MRNLNVVPPLLFLFPFIRVVSTMSTRVCFGFSMSCLSPGFQYGCGVMLASPLDVVWAVCIFFFRIRSLLNVMII